METRILATTTALANQVVFCTSLIKPILFLATLIVAIIHKGHKDLNEKGSFNFRLTFNELTRAKKEKKKFNFNLDSLQLGSFLQGCNNNIEGYLMECVSKRTGKGKKRKI